MELEERFTGCLLGLALGDALGAPFEGSAPGEKDFSRLPGLLTYTDDTEMAMGLAQSLSEKQGLDADHLARRFAADCSPGRGYGPGALAVLDLISRGVPWQQAARTVFPEGSKGNGAAMRVAPIGLFYWRDPEALDRAARQQSAVTHAHPLAQEGSALIAHAVAAIVRGLPAGTLRTALRDAASLSPYADKLRSMEELLSKEAETSEVVARLGHGVLATESVPTAIYAFLRHGTDYLRTVSFCLALGGDTDTIAAMAGALAGASLGLKALHRTYLKRLEDRDMLMDLARELLHASEPRQA
jgi:poly(ADP-ribose) glycohydrolase ARH3